jgi:hypothetical protein
VLNYSVTARIPSLSLRRPIPPPLTAAVADIPLPSVGRAVLRFCVIRSHRRGPTPSKHSHVYVLRMRSFPLRYNFFPKDFGRVSSRSMWITQGVSLHTNCVSDGASPHVTYEIESMVSLERALVNGDWTRTCPCLEEVGLLTAVCSLRP